MRPTRARRGWALELWITGLAAGGAVVTAALQISKKFSGPTWLVAVVVGFRVSTGEQHGVVWKAFAEVGHPP